MANLDRDLSSNLWAKFENLLPTINGFRRNILLNLAQQISQEIVSHGTCNLSFICTHNSRRSQIAELMTRICADYNDLSTIKTYSAGTERTAFNYRVINALETLDFNVKSEGKGENKVYTINHTHSKAIPQEMFSKVYNDSFNPSGRFIAIMVCTDAEENCPFIPNATLRVKLTYEDPKHADGTSKEEGVYLNKLLEIGSEMLLLTTYIKELQSSN